MTRWAVVLLKYTKLIRDMSNNYNMTFEESQDYISRRGFDIPWNDCDVFVDEREITRTVGNVLKWADENPSNRCYTKQQLRDMGFAFTINGDIVTPDDMGNMAERFFEYRKKKWLEKAEEFIHTYMFNNHAIEDGKEISDDIIVIEYKTVQEFIDGLCKAMEE